MTRRKVHSLTGIVPILGYVLVHLWETSAATRGRRLFADRVLGADGSTVALLAETALVLLPLGVHVGLGISMMVRDRGSRDPGSFHSRGFRNVQRATGVAALLFVLAHLSHTWMLKLGGLGPAATYDVLREQLGQPVWLVIYVVGLTCVCVHIAQGLAAAARTWQLVDTDAGARAVRVVAMLVAAALWIVSLNTLSHFAVGRALVFGAPGDEPAEVEEPAGGAEPPRAGEAPARPTGGPGQPR